MVVGVVGGRGPREGMERGEERGGAYAAKAL